MKSWTSPVVPSLPQPLGSVALRDERTGQLRAIEAPGGRASIYVCGVTPYDTTHAGHAATYVMTDTLRRALLDTGVEVTLAQNVTDIDDPLFERAARDQVDWRELAQEQGDLYRADMQALRVVAPDAYVGVVEAMPEIIEAVTALHTAGLTYQLERDTYLDVSRVETGGFELPGTLAQRLAQSAERGGDPEREGKRDCLDPMLWRGESPGEPSWDAGPLGRGRPGWHIECTVIARDQLGDRISVLAGGTDLIYPHHAMSTLQAIALTGERTPVGLSLHQAMVSYQGAKMSKSLGNLVRVSQLIDEGVDPRAIRLVLLAQHYAQEWEWTSELLRAAQERLKLWQAAMAGAGAGPAGELLAAVRQSVRTDLDTPAALTLIDQWATDHGSDSARPALVRDLVDALLGIDLP